ncbi:hypothetical protein [Actinomadura gamaensis]|uniref:Uncharacterized protein n=1 Tax=Actinomadura gamaensis TaxID=1763541 RepID=A0ABV9TZZ3_9ACTN
MPPASTHPPAGTLIAVEPDLRTTAAESPAPHHPPHFNRDPHEHQRLIHDHTETVLHAAFVLTGLPWDTSRPLPRPTGLLIHCPATLDNAEILDTFTGHMAALLQRRNRLFVDRLRLRAAVHALQSPTPGASSPSLEQAAQLLHRLISADDLQRQMTDNPDADLGIVVTNTVAEHATRPGHYRPLNLTGTPAETAARPAGSLRLTRHTGPEPVPHDFLAHTIDTREPPDTQA